MKQAATKKNKGITVKAPTRSPRSPRFVDRTYARRKAARGNDGNTVVPRGRSGAGGTGGAGGTVLPGENAAKVATPEDRERLGQLLTAMAYFVVGESPETHAGVPDPRNVFGEGIDVVSSIGINIDSSGKVALRASCTVGGRTFEV